MNDVQAFVFSILPWLSMALAHRTRIVRERRTNRVRDVREDSLISGKPVVVQDAHGRGSKCKGCKHLAGIKPSSGE